MTRAVTAWPGLSTSLIFSTRSSLICEMCTRPSMPSLSSTKAPKEVILVTAPCTTSPMLKNESMSDHGSTASCFMPRLMRSWFESTSSTIRSTSSPFFTTSDGGLELDERAVGHEVDNLAVNFRADGELAVDLVPRVLRGLLEAEGNALFLAIDLDDHDLDFLALLHHLARVRDAAPAHVGDVEK